MEGAFIGAVVGFGTSVISYNLDFRNFGFDTVGKEQLPSEFRTHLRNLLTMIGVVLGSAGVGAIIQSAIQSSAP